MKRRRHQQHISKEDCLAMSQSNTRFKNKKKKTSTNIRRRVNSSEPIPIDLIFEILLRLPIKSIARCRCVSKLWASTLRLPCFTELYLTRSSSRPRLFFSCHKSGESWFHLFSAPQVQNLSHVTASYHMKFPFSSFDHLRGLTCHTNIRERAMVTVIYNHSTRESLSLPNVKTRYNSVKSFLGYDPIDKQFKVLSMTWSQCRRNEVHQVLTLGTTTNQWRRMECSKPHYPLGKAICIDGVLYYHAYVAAYNGLDGIGNKIVCFDVRYEKFRFINGPENAFSLLVHSTLVNYKGKLGVTFSKGDGVHRQIKEFELWVLVDAEKHGWSKHVYAWPSSWKKVNVDLNFVGVIDHGTSEILLAPTYQYTYRFYVYYYNLEKKTIRRVKIEGMDMVKDHKVDIFLDHLEDVKLLKMV